MTHLVTKRLSRWLLAFGILTVLVLTLGGLPPNTAAASVGSNQAPDCSNAAPSRSVIKKPNKKFRKIHVLGITDPDGDEVTIEIFAIRQDEPVGKIKPGKKKRRQHAPDGKGIGTDTAKVRAERLGRGDGRVYTITVRATDEQGAMCVAFLKVSVPKGKKPAIEGPLWYDSTVPS